LIDSGVKLICFVVCVVGAALAVGCAHHDPAAMEKIRTAYRDGQYGRASRQAQTIMRYGPNADRDEATYMSGLSAYRLKDFGVAQRRLLQVAKCNDSALAGDALVMLGLIYLEQERHEQASRAFMDASRRLKQGQDRANAYFYAAKAQQSLGRWPQAHTNLNLARNSSSDLEFRKHVAQALMVTGFTLQAGAFTSEVNAYRVAENLLPETMQFGLGRPRLVPAIDQGDRNLYLVQIGQFASHASALAARTQLRAPSIIIVPLSASNFTLSDK